MVNIFFSLIVSLPNVNAICLSFMKGESADTFNCLTHLSLASLLLDIGVPSGAILFAERIYIRKWDKK